jgi:hypothetical protein
MRSVETLERTMSEIEVFLTAQKSRQCSEKH